MPLPLIPVIGSAIAGWFAGKAAKTALFVGTMTAILAALWASLNAFFNGLNVFFYEDGLWHSFWMGVTFFIPDNFTTCFTICMGADLAVFMYRFFSRTLAVGSS
jgi:biotin transporter BioY